MPRNRPFCSRRCCSSPRRMEVASWASLSPCRALSMHPATYARARSRSGRRPYPLRCVVGVRKIRRTAQSPNVRAPTPTGSLLWGSSLACSQARPQKRLHLSQNIDHTKVSAQDTQTSDPRTRRLPWPADPVRSRSGVNQNWTRARSSGSPGNNQTKAHRNPA